jgi:peptidoglycan/LPS O-acetylase OafA/YrhL
MEEQTKSFLPALTGMRFIAALLVTLAHFLPHIMPFSDPPLWYQLLSGMAAEAMMTFFVLSGFVIHYNYSEQIEKHGRKGIRNFLVARLARVYPLYVVVIVLQLLMDTGYSAVPAWTGTALPFFLLLMQTWIFYPLGQFGLVYALGLVAVAWSVSTECFFYIAYPALHRLLRRISTIPGLLRLAVLSGALICGIVISASINQDGLNAWALQHFGTIGNQSQLFQYTFYRWLIYFSPYTRIFEFILGCITAAILMKCPQQVSLREERTGKIVLMGALVLLAAQHYFLFAVTNPPGPLHFLFGFHMCYGFAPLLAVIMFCLARYKSAIARSLSSWHFVLCGEATYSLYLFHTWIFLAFRWEAATVTSFMVGIADLIRMTVAFMSAIGLALVSWRMIEVPARKWVRNLLSVESASDQTNATPSEPLKL